MTLNNRWFVKMVDYEIRHPETGKVIIYGRAIQNDGETPEEAVQRDIQECDLGAVICNILSN